MTAQLSHVFLVPRSGSRFRYKTMNFLTIFGASNFGHCTDVKVNFTDEYFMGEIFRSIVYFLPLSALLVFRLIEYT